MGDWAGAGFLVDGAHCWAAGIAGIWVFYLPYPGCGDCGFSPQFPGHPSSICDADITMELVI